MDIGNPSNFERILALFHNDHAAFCKVVKAVKVTDKETVEAIKKVYKKYSYVMDFHTAVGYLAGEKITDSTVHTVVVSTASPLKFAKEIMHETGITVNNTLILKNLKKNKKRVIMATRDYQAIKRIVINTLG